MGVAAEIGLKRDHALAWTGCYFDGGATMCGANASAICGERGFSLRSTWPCALDLDLAPHSRRYARKAVKRSIVA